MKRKTVQLSVQIPAEYKWIAVMPFGTWFAFKRRPQIWIGQEPPEDPSPEARVKYWDKQPDELELFSENIDRPDWEQSLKQI